MSKHGGLETKHYSSPTHVMGGSHAKVEKPNLSARGDSPTAPPLASSLKATGSGQPSDEPVFTNTPTGPISKLGVPEKASPAQII